MKRKLHRLFEENSQDETSLPAHSDSSHSIISWKLESLESENSSFDLNFNQNNICIVGRKDLSNSKYISVIHCEIFQNSFGELFLSSKARYDVIYIDNILALKDIPILLKEGCIIRFCKGHFSFKLQKNIVENCERNSTVDMPLENHVIITQNEMRERMDMSLEDIDARVRTRHIRELDITNSICRKILSSFYCDICIEVIASCRSCVPCGHNFCFPCITQYISISKGGPAKCPKCRNAIQQTIPNKSIDAAISECLTNIKNAFDSCVARVVPSVTPIITESQDINLWTSRYEDNEAQGKAKSTTAAQVVPRIPVPIPLPRLPPVPARTIIPPIVELDYEDDDDEDEDEDDEDDDEEEEDEAESRFDGSAASAEYARSNRSRCIMCDQSIANQELRIAVTESSYEYYNSNTRFIHVRCIRAFNQMVSVRQRIQAATINLRGVSQADATRIRNSF